MRNPFLKFCFFLYVLRLAFDLLMIIIVIVLRPLLLDRRYLYIFVAFSVQAIEMLSSAQSSVPIIFLVTDGTVEDERQICAMVKNHMINGESICPRIYTFGIGIASSKLSLDQNFPLTTNYITLFTS